MPDLSKLKKLLVIFVGWMATVSLFLILIAGLLVYSLFK